MHIDKYAQVKLEVSRQDSWTVLIVLSWLLAYCFFKTLPCGENEYRVSAYYFLKLQENLKLCQKF